MAAIPKLEAREVARDAMFGYIELGPDSLWALMEEAGVSVEERRRYFANRAAALTAADRKADFPKEYGKASQTAAKNRPPSTAKPRTVQELLDEAER